MLTDRSLQWRIDSATALTLQILDEIVLAPSQVQGNQVVNASDVKERSPGKGTALGDRSLTSRVHDLIAPDLRRREHEMSRICNVKAVAESNAPLQQARSVNIEGRGGRDARSVSPLSRWSMSFFVVSVRGRMSSSRRSAMSWTSNGLGNNQVGTDVQGGVRQRRGERRHP